MEASAGRARLGALVFGAMAAEAVFAAAQLRIADVISDGQRSCDDIAAEIGALPTALARLLRVLAALELLAEPVPMQFRLTEAGQLLRADQPDSMLAFVRMFGDPVMLSAWRELETAIRTGETPFERIYGTGFFEHLSANPDLSERFNAAMRQGTAVAARQVLRHYDFGAFRTVADIGGGDGTLLAAVLVNHPSTRGILYDTAAGLAQAGATLAKAGVGDRCEVRTGDFLEAAPPGADLYIVKSVLQDWDDDNAGTILAHIRAVVPDHGRLLIIEPVLPERVDASAPVTMYLGDLNMLVNLGGRERTLAELKRLCEEAHFSTASTIRLAPPVALSMLEATPR
ncbi:methyltransferase [Mycobacterium spongiae]|uniref:Methyltransferase n=1 Tax=Mycobacterium spongiae TaxID=886343 RepID=A0A975PXM7_9MYCO|nr:methyltransferase [Mycobacterium spongiae]QUR68262.1 methyltransferase [Mycobacterium spongiae]